MAEKKTYSQRKRDKFDYRREYFKHNPGIFGCIWTCAYCHKALIGRDNVVVDHIMPLNNVLGQNARFNLVAACQRCNSKKSDRVDYRVGVGYFSKLLEMIVFTVQKILIISVVAVWTVIQKIVKGALYLLVAPFRSGSIILKLIALIVYAGIAAALAQKLGWR